MVIGLGLGADEGWTQRQQAALDRIEQELTASRRAEQALLARQRELVREMEHWRALVERGLPLLAEGRLAHQRVALFAPGGRPPQELADLLRWAGAAVMAVGEGGRVEEPVQPVWAWPGRVSPRKPWPVSFCPPGSPRPPTGSFSFPTGSPTGSSPCPTGGRPSGPPSIPRAWPSSSWA